MSITDHEIRELPADLTERIEQYLKQCSGIRIDTLQGEIKIFDGVVCVKLTWEQTHGAGDIGFILRVNLKRIPDGWQLVPDLRESMEAKAVWLETYCIEAFGVDRDLIRCNSHPLAFEAGWIKPLAHLPLPVEDTWWTE